MNINPLTLLLIEDLTAEAELIEALLEEVEDISWQIIVASRLQDGLKQLSAMPVNIVLLDLSLPDSYGMDTLITVKNQAPTVPIIVMTVTNDRQLALDALRLGAQDYLIKGKFDGELLSRSINYAIERQRIKAELQQQIERERLLGRMSERIRNSLELSQILETTVKEVRQFLNTDRVIIYRCRNGKSGQIVAESLKDGSVLQPADTNAAMAAMAVQSIVPPEIYVNASELNTFDRGNVRLESLIRAVLTVPIWQSQQPSGEPPYLWGQLIAHDFSGKRQWQQWEIEFLTQLANQVAIAIKQSELVEALERLAALDGLTGVANRRQFDRVIAQEWQRLAREKQPISLILCDIDFFKQYNDFYLHLAGDDCLKQVARALEKTSRRASDLVARYGGEEFAILLPNTDRKGAYEVAQNIKQQLAALKMSHARSAVNEFVTLSMGIETTIPTLDAAPSSLIDRADRALMAAKAQGRDRIVGG